MENCNYFEHGQSLIRSLDGWLDGWTGRQINDWFMGRDQISHPGSIERKNDRRTNRLTYCLNRIRWARERLSPSQFLVSPRLVASLHPTNCHWSKSRLNIEFERTSWNAHCQKNSVLLAIIPQRRHDYWARSYSMMMMVIVLWWCRRWSNGRIIVNSFSMWMWPNIPNAIWYDLWICDLIVHLATTTTTTAT